MSDVSDASGHGEIREWAEQTLVIDLVRILLGVLTEQGKLAVRHVDKHIRIHAHMQSEERKRAQGEREEVLKGR